MHVQFICLNSQYIPGYVCHNRTAPAHLLPLNCTASVSRMDLMRTTTLQQVHPNCTASRPLMCITQLCSQYTSTAPQVDLKSTANVPQGADLPLAYLNVYRRFMAHSNYNMSTTNVEEYLRDNSPFKLGIKVDWSCRRNGDGIPHRACNQVRLTKPRGDRV